MQYFLEFFANGIENSNTLPVKNFSAKILGKTLILSSIIINAYSVFIEIID